MVHAYGHVFSHLIKKILGGRVSLAVPGAPPTEFINLTFSFREDCFEAKLCLPGEDCFSLPLSRSSLQPTMHAPQKSPGFGRKYARYYDLSGRQAAKTRNASPLIAARLHSALAMARRMLDMDHALRCPTREELLRLSCMIEQWPELVRTVEDWRLLSRSTLHTC